MESRIVTWSLTYDLDGNLEHTLISTNLRWSQGNRDTEVLLYNLKNGAQTVKTAFAKFESRFSGYTYINTKNMIVITYYLITIKNFDNNHV